MFTFFFSSRRRHTSYIGDWSSDVCSSDLEARVGLRAVGLLEGAHGDARGDAPVGPARHAGEQRLVLGRVERQIGRASCRERGDLSYSAVAGDSILCGILTPRVISLMDVFR